LRLLNQDKELIAFRGFGRVRPEMRGLLICDFDGTITDLEISYALLDRFAPGNWRDLNHLYLEGRIGSREAYKRIIRYFRGTQEEVVGFLRERACIDPHFSPLLRFCRERELEFIIVSDGFDLYISAILEHHGLEVPFLANHLEINGRGARIGFPHLNPECGRCGTCKRRILEERRPAEGQPVIYVGDGLSDRCAALEADLVYAKGMLRRELQRAGKRFVPVENLGEVVQDLRGRL